VAINRDKRQDVRHPFQLRAKGFVQERKRVADVVGIGILIWRKFINRSKIRVMKPRERAKSIMDKSSDKEVAMAVCNDLMSFWIYLGISDRIKYWEEVKSEIEKL
jgi:hypothetical protein